MLVLLQKNYKKKNKKLFTYSYIPEDDFEDWTPWYYMADERPFIKETVNHVGNIQDHYLNFAGKNPYDEIDDFLSIMEMPYKFFENSYWLKGISQAAQKDGVKILLNGARGNHSISWGSYQLTMDYYVSLFKKLKWIRLYNELDMYCKNFKTGKSVMLPIVAKKSLPMVSKLLTKTPMNRIISRSFINPALAQRTNVYEKLQEYGIGSNGVTG